MDHQTVIELTNIFLFFWILYSPYHLMTLVMPTVTDITSSTNGLVASFFSNLLFFLVLAVIVS